MCVCASVCLSACTQAHVCKHVYVLAHMYTGMCNERKFETMIHKSTSLLMPSSSRGTCRAREVDQKEPLEVSSVFPCLSSMGESDREDG